MTTVILPTGKTFTAAWSADAFEHLWAAEVIGADVVEIVTQFPGNDEILVKTDGMRDITYYGYKYLDSLKVMPNGNIQITLRNEV